MRLPGTGDHGRQAGRLRRPDGDPGRGGRRVPEEVRGALADGERLLAWSGVRGDPASFVAATDGALHVIGATSTRLPWDLVDKATWDDEEILVVEARRAPGEPLRSWRIPLAEGQRLPTVVYERVTSNVVVSERVRLEGDAGARLVARRSGDGVRWTVTFDPGLDPRDPRLRAQAQAALDDLRGTLGL